MDIESCIKEYGAHYFSFNDEAMTAPVMKKLSQEIISRNLDIKWMNDSRLDKALDEETLKLAYQSGLRRLLFGLESYNERVLSLMNKGIRREWVEPIIKASSAAGIWTHIFIIGGFPTETKEEFEETCEFIRKNNIYIDSTNVTPFTATRFSDVTMNPHKYNLEIINDDHLDLSPNSESRMTDPSDNLTHPIRFDLTGHAPASGNKFLEIYDNPAFMIFADYLKECTQRAKLGEEPSTPIGTPIYSKNGKVEYITAFNQQDKFTIVRVPESAEPFVAALDNNYFKSDAYKELSEITGYPAPVLDIMVERVRASLIK